MIRNRYVKHKAQRWDSRAILLLIATSGGALIIQNNFELVYTHFINASKNYQKEISSRTGDILIMISFRK